MTERFEPASAERDKVAARDKVLYLTYHGIMDSVFGSQVLAYVELLRDAFDVHLIAMDSMFSTRGAAYQAQSERIRATLDGNCTLTTHVPFAGPPSLRCDSRQVLRVAQKMAGGGRRLIIHGRAQVCGYLGVLVKRAMPSGAVRVITDTRGAVVEETIYAAKSLVARASLPIRLAQLRTVERTALAGSDAVFAVSTPLMDYLDQRYHLPAIRKVIPTCVNTASFAPAPEVRTAMRDDLDIGDRLAVAYNGSMTAWHLPNEIIRTFATVKRLVPNSFLVLVTKDADLAEQAATRGGLAVGGYVIRSAQHSEVPQYLAACDLAILVRDNSVVNAVACPTKFAEYLSCGLPVVISPGIGDTESIVRKYRVGIVLPDELTQDKLLALRNDVSARESAIQAAKEVFDLQQGVENITQVYRELLAGEQQDVKSSALA